jgi:hypothetical protein
MKPSTIVYSVAAFCKVFGLGGMGISLVSTNVLAAGVFGLVAAAGAGLDAAASVLKNSGNGNA